MNVNIKRSISRQDDRPICTCPAYDFPHRVGGRCTGAEFTTFYYYNIRTECFSCNCNSGTQCDVSIGAESIKEAECHIAAKHYNPGGYLPLTLIEPEPPEEPPSPTEYYDERNPPPLTEYNGY